MIEASAAPDAMRIRSEAIDPGARRFIPALIDDAPPPVDLGQFERLADALAQALTAFAGLPVTAALTGWSAAGWASDDRPTTRIGDSLAAVMTSIRFGGNVADTASPGGVATARTAARLAAIVDGLALSQWPACESGGGVDVELTLAGVAHDVWVAAPVLPPVAAAPRASLAAAMLDQPFRMPLAISSEMIEVGRLLPVVAGTVWPMAPQPASILAIGGQRIALVRIEPTTDGRQQAVVVGLNPLNGDAR